MRVALFFFLLACPCITMNMKEPPQSSDPTKKAPPVYRMEEPFPPESPDEWPRFIIGLPEEKKSSKSSAACILCCCVAALYCLHCCKKTGQESEEHLPS